MLAEFGNVADAVKFAVDAQLAINSSEAAADPDRRIRFRIVVHVGDIVVDGDDILGDSVNIAARLETLAEPGGVCISEDVFRNIKGKLELTFTDMGEQELKNIKDPVRTWRWQDGDVAANEESPTALPQTVDTIARGKPTLAVLPFDNISGDEEQEYFADGMTEDLITELSRMP